MDRLDAMRGFVQVVDSGSFTRAAQVLERHKASLSQQLLQLEAHLGVRLLNRTTRSVAPTAEGLAYYRRALEILALVDQAEGAARRGRMAAAGLLRVAVPVALGRLVLMPEVPALLERHPRLTLDLACGDQRVDLLREGIDCAIRGGELPDSGLVARRIGSVSFVLCAAPGYAARHGLPGTPAALAGHWQVGYRPAQQARVPAWRLLQGSDAIEVEVPARLVTNDSGALLSAGLDGIGIVRVAEFVARPYLAGGALVPVLSGWSCPPLPLQLIATSARLRAARVQVFIEWAQAVLQRALVAAAPAQG